MRVLYSGLVILFICCCVSAQNWDRTHPGVRAIEKGLNYTIWPYNVDVIESHGELVEDVFGPNVTGRITPVGEFHNFLETIEYFYVLGGPLTGAAPGRQYITSYDIAVLDFNGNRVSLQVNLHLAVFNMPLVMNLTVIGFMLFDTTDWTIRAYDLHLTRVGEALDPLYNINTTSVMIGVCQGVQAFCTGANQQYESFSACLSFMQSIPYGSWGTARSHSVICRAIHTILAGSRPDFHCPHAGPTGGEKCVTWPYAEYYDTNYIGLSDPGYNCEVSSAALLRPWVNLF